MKENDEDKMPLLRVRAVGQRAATPERTVFVQTDSPAGGDAGARPTMTAVVSSAAGEAGDKPIKRIAAADVEKMLGATAVAAIERMRRGRSSS